LEATLRADGAAVDVLSAEGGHGLSDEDVRLTGEWLQQKL
jgi:phospholipase/carboxylesterase